MWKIIKYPTIMQKYAFNEHGQLKSITHKKTDKNGKLFTMKGKPKHSLSICYSPNDVPFTGYGIGFNGEVYNIPTNTLRKLWYSDHAIELTPEIQDKIANTILPKRVPNFFLQEISNEIKPLEFNPHYTPKMETVFKDTEVPKHISDAHPEATIFYIPLKTPALHYIDDMPF